jgi:hypothetical protein
MDTLIINMLGIAAGVSPTRMEYQDMGGEGGEGVVD